MLLPLQTEVRLVDPYEAQAGGAAGGAAAAAQVHAMVEKVRQGVELAASYSIYLRVDMNYITNGQPRWFPGWVSGLDELAHKMDIAFMNGEVEEGVSLFDPDVRITRVRLASVSLSHKALPLSCVSTVFLSKAVPFHAVLHNTQRCGWPASRPRQRATTRPTRQSRR
eukprot:SAG22_NODE_687_length_7913_cov_2.611851_2_plen_167_part_00